MSEVAVVEGEFDLWTEHWNKEDNKERMFIFVLCLIHFTVRVSTMTLYRRSVTD